MTLEFLLISGIISAFCRYIIFKKRDVKRPITAFIPGINKYKLGKLVGSKKLGILNAIFFILLGITFIGCFGIELYIIQNYVYQITNPIDGVSESTIEALVPKDIANLAIGSKYALIGIAFASIVVWSIMMWKFTIQHGRNPWWIMLWTIIPVIPYVAFAASPVVVIDGKKYTTTRVEISETTSEKRRNKKNEKPT